MTSVGPGSYKVDHKKMHQPAPEEEYKTPGETDSSIFKMFNFEEEERKLMDGIKNLENKDDFWISLS